MIAARLVLLLGAGLLAAFTIMPVDEPADLASPTPPEPRWRPGLHFVTSVAVDEAAMTAAAKAAWNEAMRLMGHGPEDFFLGPITVYVCADWDELRLLSWKRGRRDMVPVSGWYDRYGPAILMRHEEGRNCLTIAHEMTHHAVAQLTDRCPPVFNEGLACLVTREVLTAPEHQPAIRTQHERWVAQVRKALADDRVPPLWKLMRKGFYADTKLHYPLALCLVDVMARRSPDAMNAMMGQFGKERAWTAFVRAYPALEVRKEWRAAVDRFARGDADE